MMAHATKQPARRRSPTQLHSEIAAEKTLRSFGNTEAPIRVEDVARKLGLRVERTAFGDDVSGLLVVHEDRGVIGVNEAHTPERQRFTIAHEIGHFVLHRQAMPVFIDKQFLKPYLTAFRNSVSSTGEDKREREANAFAAALLMPVRALYSEIERLDSDLTDDDAVEQLARKFRVSRQAMSFRLANLANRAGALGD